MKRQGGNLIVIYFKTRVRDRLTDAQHLYNRNNLTLLWSTEVIASFLRIGYFTNSPQLSRFRQTG